MITVPLVVFITMVSLVLGMLGVAVAVGKHLGSQREINGRLADNVEELKDIQREIHIEVKGNSKRLTEVERSLAVQEGVQAFLVKQGAKA